MLTSSLNIAQGESNLNLHNPLNITCPKLRPGPTQLPYHLSLFHLLSLKDSWQVAAGLGVPGPFAELPQAWYW